MGIARQLISPKPDEPISYRLIVLGLLSGSAFIVGFCLKMGMGLWIIIVYFAIWFAIAIGDYASAGRTRFTRPRLAFHRT